MFKPLSIPAFKDLRNAGYVIILVKKGWEARPWSSCPHNVYFRIATDQEKIFTCYVSVENGFGKTMTISNVEPTSLIKGETSLVDAYLRIAIEGMIEHAQNLSMGRLVLMSPLTLAIDHMLDLGFRFTGRCKQGEQGSQGYFILGDKKDA